MSDSIRVHPWAALIIRPAAVLIAVFVGVASFILSFTALADIAVRAHVPPAQAWLWPCAVDGATLLATLGAVVCMADRQARRFFWGVLIGGLAVSIGGNDLHAILPAGQALPWALRAIVGAVAPVAVVVSIHGLTILLRVRRIDAAGASAQGAPSTTSAAAARRPAAPVPDRTAPKATPAPRSDQHVGAASTTVRGEHADTVTAAAAADPDEPLVANTDTQGYHALAEKVLPLLTVKDLDTEQIAEVLAMSYDQALPNRDIGRRLELRHHTVGKILDASAQVLREQPLARAS